MASFSLIFIYLIITLFANADPVLLLGVFLILAGFGGFVLLKIHERNKR